MSGCRSTTPRGSLPTAGTRRASRSPKSSAASTSLRTSIAVRRNLRIWEEKDPKTQQLLAIKHYISTYEQTRTIWMDDRPHPGPNAPHTWMGFSTGRYDGDMLVVETTHLKQGWIRRNGLPMSDRATMTEYFVRNGDLMTHIVVLVDPVYLTEPLVKSQEFSRGAARTGAAGTGCGCASRSWRLPTARRRGAGVPAGRASVQGRVRRAAPPARSSRSAAAPRRCIRSSSRRSSKAEDDEAAEAAGAPPPVGNAN